MRLRLPLHILVSFMGAHLVALAVIVRCAVNGQSDPLCLISATALAFGATAALFERTWGVGLMLAAAVAFFSQSVMGLGATPPPFQIALLGSFVGTLPFIFTMKHMARFHLGATILFMMIAGAVGTGAALFVRAIQVAIDSSC